MTDIDYLTVFLAVLVIYGVLLLTLIKNVTSE
mgnify:CR=1 FL=1